MTSVSWSLRENILSDIETWERSGQWVFSCYSNLRVPISGLYQICVFTKAFLHIYNYTVVVISF